MLSSLDAVLLARIQFAFTISFHIIFPAFTIGLASFLAVLEGLYLKTGKAAFASVYKFWVKIFAVCFGLGVVSGIVLSYQIGTNWATFADKTGNVIGPLLGYEVLTAFFLEASFLGIMLFGWDRVSRRMHFASTVIVAVGTVISAFWILSANSWMQTPQGFTIGDNGLFYPQNWLEVIFNPSFFPRFFHMVTAAYLTTAFTVGGIGAYYLFKKRHKEEARIMFAMAMLMAVFVTPVQIFFGHWHGENTHEHQPIKVAAMEGNWDTGTHRPLYLFGWPDEEAEATKYGITIPNAASIIVTGSADGEIKGLKEVAKEDRPPVAIVFWAFRIMVGIGVLMLVTGIWGAVLHLRKRLYDSRLFHYWCMAMTPSGFIAVLAGWFVTEVGRQPYTVYGVLRTGESISPVMAEQVALSLLLFIITYTLLFGAGTYYILRLIGHGPKKHKPTDEDETFYSHSNTHSLTEGIINEDIPHV